MRPLVTIGGVIALGALPLVAQRQVNVWGGPDECGGCNTIPFTPDPPCSVVCRKWLIQHADLNDLWTILGISKNTARRMRQRRSTDTQSLDDYEDILGVHGLAQLNDRLQKITQSDLDTLLEGMIGEGGRGENPSPPTNRGNPDRDLLPAPIPELDREEHSPRLEEPGDRRRP